MYCLVVAPPRSLLHGHQSAVVCTSQQKFERRIFRSCGRELPGQKRRAAALNFLLRDDTQAHKITKTQGTRVCGTFANDFGGQARTPKKSK